jgi:CysZ protein
MTRGESRRPSAVREFFTGVGFIGRGFALWRTAPGLMLLGMVPALIVGAVFIAGIVVIGVNLESIAEGVTPFANDWDEPFRTGVRVIAGLAFLAAAILILLLLFTTVTLIVGEPFYERIWRHVESGFGPVPSAAPAGFWRGLGGALTDGLRMLVPAALTGVLLFALGFVPLVGTAVAAVLGVFVGGWFLAVELTGLAFDGRGRSLRERRGVLRGRRAMTVGFGVTAYLLFLIPLGAVLVMPAAVAGATLLSRRALGEPDRLR